MAYYSLAIFVKCNICIIFYSPENRLYANKVAYQPSLYPDLYTLDETNNYRNNPIFCDRRTQLLHGMQVRKRIPLDSQIAFDTNNFTTHYYNSVYFPSYCLELLNQQKLEEL